MVDLSKGHPHVSANFWLLESGPLTRNLSGACSSFITWVFKGGLISEGFLIQLKFGYSEKATKFEIMLPSQNIQTYLLRKKKFCILFGS